MEDDRLERWWLGLTDEERVAAQQAVSSGTLDPEVHRTLVRDGIIQPSARPASPLPRPVIDYLKMRHD